MRRRERLCFDIMLLQPVSDKSLCGSHEGYMSQEVICKLQECPGRSENPLLRNILMNIWYNNLCSWWGMVCMGWIQSMQSKMYPIPRRITRSCNFCEENKKEVLYCSPTMILVACGTDLYNTEIARAPFLPLEGWIVSMTTNLSGYPIAMCNRIQQIV